MADNQPLATLSRDLVHQLGVLCPALRRSGATSLAVTYRWRGAVVSAVPPNVIWSNNAQRLLTPLAEALDHVDTGTPNITIDGRLSSVLANYIVHYADDEDVKVATYGWFRLTITATGSALLEQHGATADDPPRRVWSYPELL